MYTPGEHNKTENKTKGPGRKGGSPTENEPVFLRYVFHGASYSGTTVSTALANSPLSGDLR